MRRRNSYEEFVAQEMKDIRFAREFLVGLTQEEGGDPGFSIEDALRHTIDAMGVKEFCQLSGMPQPNVSDFLNGKRKLKPETLDLYLKPFGLKTKLTLEPAS